MASLKNKDCGGVVLAGGKSSRFGSDKAFYTPLGFEKTWVEMLAEKMLPFVSTLYISIHKCQFQRMSELFYKYPQIIFCVDDEITAYYGPLGGLYQANKRMNESHYLLSPVDVPNLSFHVLKKLQKYPNCYVKTPIHNHYLIAHLAKNEAILQHLIQINEHRVIKWIELLQAQPLFFNDDTPFQNFNSPPS